MKLQSLSIASAAAIALGAVLPATNPASLSGPEHQPEIASTMDTTTWAHTSFFADPFAREDMADPTKAHAERGSVARESSLSQDVTVRSDDDPHRKMDISELHPCLQRLMKNSNPPLNLDDFTPHEWCRQKWMAVGDWIDFKINWFGQARRECSGQDKSMAEITAHSKEWVKKLCHGIKPIG
jgi:hypothetical protein